MLATTITGLHPVTLGDKTDPELADAPVTDDPPDGHDPAGGGRLRNEIVASGQQHGGPPIVDPGPAPGRRALHSIATWLADPPSPEGHPGLLQVPAGPATGGLPTAVSLDSGDPQRGNSYRLTAQPWDSALYTAVQTG